MSAEQPEGQVETPETPEISGESEANEGASTEDQAAPSEQPAATAGTTAAASTATRLRELEQEGEIAADYLEELLDICDMDGDLDLDVEGDRAVVAIVGAKLDKLVGSQGEVLDALQELTRLAVHQQTGNRSRLMLDVGGHRARRRRELTSLGEAAARRVTESGRAERLAPMTPFERKVVHDAVAGVDGVRSESEGDEPERRVVVLPA
jgi:spoIIIJ-associated protein